MDTLGYLFCYILGFSTMFVIWMLDRWEKK